ncbi:ribonuclease H-like domain-containing protein [Tanacetum coccineum]
MELENSQNNSLAKLPILKLGEYEMWEIRIKQYFQIQDYALWEVIENGNSWVPIPVTTPESGPSTALKMTVSSTTEEKMCKKNDVKARSLLLMALPNEHQLTFNQYVDAQSMFIAIKARFGGNEATKRTQKALLKQQYENFNASSSESLDSIFNRLQKLVSRLAILGVVTPPEDLNVKFLRSLPSESGFYVLVMDSKVNTASNVVTSTASSCDATVYAFLSTQPQGSQLVHEDLEQLHDDDLEEMDLKWNMALLSMRARKFYQRTRRKIIIDGSSTAGYDKSKGNLTKKNQSKASNGFEDASEKAMCAIDGSGFDWSAMAEDEIQANMALMAFSDSEVSNDKSCSKSCVLNYKSLKKQYDDLLVKLDDTAFKAATYKRGLSILEAQVVKYKESEVLFSEEIALLKRSVGHKDYLMGLVKTELEKVKEEKEGFEFKLTKFEKSSKDLDALLASQVTDKSKKGFGYNAVPSPHPLILNRPTPLDLSYSGLAEFAQPEVNEYGPRDSSLKLGVKDEEDVESYPKEERKMMDLLLPEKESVKTVKPSRRSVRAIRRLNDKGFVDSGCSRHMSAKGGRITGKGTIKTDKLDFEDVYFVKELEVQTLFVSVSQIVVPKRTCSFYDTECLVLSPNFKLPDENQTLLKIPRQNNMYSFDMKNIVPKDGLTCIQGVSQSSTSSPQDQASQDCIVMPIWKNNSTDDLLVNTASPVVNTGSRLVSTADPEVNTATSEDLVGPSSPFEEEMGDQEIELGNLSPSYQVLTYAPQKYGRFLSTIYEGKTHQDLHTCLFACFLFQEEPKRVSKALSDPAWVEAIQEEILQFKLQKVWVLVDLPKGQRAIGTKWVYRNKKDERGIVIRNKARLVAQGHTQEESMDYDEVFAPVARIEAIRIFLAYSSFMGFTVYQMDVKSAFLYGQIEEEFNYTHAEVCLQLPTDLEKPLVKDADADEVDEHLYRSMIGCLMYLIASRLDIMFTVCVLWYSTDSPLEFVAYTDSDYDRASLGLEVYPLEVVIFRKIGLLFLACKDTKCSLPFYNEAGILWLAAIVVMGQVLWIQNQLLDYGYNFSTLLFTLTIPVPYYCIIDKSCSTS